MSSAEIILMGDICPAPDTMTLFMENNTTALLADVKPLLENADMVIANHEFVLTDHPKPIVKTGPILHAQVSVSGTLKSMGIDIMSLGNNHIRDCGDEGVQSTIAGLTGSGIEVFGAGEGLEAAKKPLIKEINGIKIGIMVFAEQEFNTASGTRWGAAYFDPWEDPELIRETKNRVDFLILLYHGGIENYRYPSPMLQMKCRKFIEWGADFVSCQHSHIIGTPEEYKGKKILYGQGNTLFGYRKDSPEWNSGLLVRLVWEGEKDKPQFELIPITAVKEGGIQLMPEDRAEKELKELEKRSLYLNDSEFIKKSWAEFCEKLSPLYMGYLFGWNKWLIRLNRLTGGRLPGLLYSHRRKITTHNILRCESHREVIREILKQNE